MGTRTYTRPMTAIGMAFLAVAFSGCATMTAQPAMSETSILPRDLKPGDTAVVTVRVQDKFGVVKRVEGLVKEDRTIAFHFLDDGVPPDAIARDGVWTIQVDVPFNAPPGRFELEVSGYDARGELVVVEDKQGESAALTSSVSLEIRYPDEAGPPAGAQDTPPAPAPDKP